jgi:multidrug efflux pump subunit AcrA (membrane-fusion protein)
MFAVQTAFRFSRAPLFVPGLLASALWLHACGGASGDAKAAAGAASAAQPRPVRVITATQDRLARTVAVTGTLAAE